MDTEVIKAIKKEIGFREQISCEGCEHHQKYEKDANAPVQLFCTYAGGIRFEVSEDDWCNKHSEI